MKDIYNFLFYNEKLSSSGMPTPEQIASIAETGVQVVINLATFKSEGAMPNERELVEAHGMKYFHIPVEWDAPTQQNLEDFFSAMDAHTKDKIHVHCQANYRATGFVALYRILKLGWKKDDALQYTQEIWDIEEYPIWQQFIEANLPPE